MIVIRARNVADAWPQAIRLIQSAGAERPSRAGPVLVVPEPVTTVYERPWERVLLDPVRDANPMFHLAEALWMLAGRDDATWLEAFVSDFSSRFAEPDGRMHGAYGKRWRDWFEPASSLEYHHEGGIDQLDEVVWLLRANPDDRQAVISMWDPSSDLGVPGLRDRPCNTQIYLRADRTDASGQRYLDMTVTCRSNDIVFGCYGANAVHFSVLHEYLAARIGLRQGRYTQVSNNWHMYLDSLPRANLRSAEAAATEPYPGSVLLFADAETLDDQVSWFVETGHALPLGDLGDRCDRFLRLTAHPLVWAARHWRAGNRGLALEAASAVEANDWRLATKSWMQRRMAR